MKKSLKTFLLFMCALGLSSSINAQIDTSPKMMKAKKHQNNVQSTEELTNVELASIEIIQENKQIFDTLKSTNPNRYNSLLNDLQKMASLKNDIVICTNEGKIEKISSIEAELKELKDKYNLK